jgi:ligand-binding sensor domain-containing protein
MRARAALAAVSALVLVLACEPIAAQGPLIGVSQYSHTAWRLQDAVFDAAPISIAQTTDGFLWIGTMNGLVRFDGVHFESWNDRIRELHACCAWSLLGSSDGSLWIGTAPALARLKEGHLSIIPSDARHDDIIEDHKGRIWVGRTSIRDDKGPLCEVQGTQLQCHSKQDGLNCILGNHLAEDKNGTIWVGDAGKACSWNHGATASYLAASNDGACKPALDSLVADPSNLMLVGCHGGLRRLEQGKFAPFRVASLDADKLKEPKLLYDRAGSLWIGTANDGLYYISNGVADHFGQADGLSDDKVSSLYEDREDNIWVATPNGLDRFHRLSVVSSSTKQGLPGLDDAAVLASHDGHTLWVSGQEGLSEIRDGKIIRGRSIPMVTVALSPVSTSISPSPTIGDLYWLI